MTMRPKRKRTVPTLTKRDATGGQVAATGLQFQTNVALAYLPGWLAHDGFSSMIVESMGDTEAKFFVPGAGFLQEFVEVKDYALSPAPFWKEIDRFIELDEASPNTYRRFVLVCDGVSPTLAPLVNALRRVRDPLKFYERQSPIGAASYSEYANNVKKLKRTDADARFLFDRVVVDTDLAAAKQNGASVFSTALCSSMGEYNAVATHGLHSAYVHLKDLIEKQMNQPITRQQLEATLRASLDATQCPSPRSVHMHTMIQDDDERHPTALRFKWAQFFGGEARSYPPQAEWDKAILGDLKSAKEWTVQNRSSRAIKLTGNRRLSTSFALGSVFSAVAGFSIEIESRGGEMWRTDDHSAPGTPEYPLRADVIPGTEPGLVLVLSIGRDICGQVKGCLASLGLEKATLLHLCSGHPIISAQQANLAVKLIKENCTDVLEQNRPGTIHLFLFGPAFLALLLGHRFNATAPVQCYEWVSSGRYDPSCRVG